MPVVDLYISQISDGTMGMVYPPERQLLIENSANETSRRQRYYVWKLLEYALKNSLGLQLDHINFSVDKHGKWSCNDCFFSLSHSGNAVAVAVSRQPVGVDIEDARYRCRDGMHLKILTEKELAEYKAIAKEQKNFYLLQKWCAKESIFKASDNECFRPRTIETERGVGIGSVKVGENNYCYAVAAEHHDKLRIFTDIDL